MDIFRKTWGRMASQQCAKEQPIFEPIQRVDNKWRKSSSQFVKMVKEQKQKEKINPEQKLSNLTKLLAEICELINNLERRLYCFLMELKRTKTNEWKYNYLSGLYTNITPETEKIMEIFDYLRYEEIKDPSGGEEFVRNIYYQLLKHLRNIGKQLLHYLTIKENMQSLNYRYQYQQNTGIPKCYKKADEKTVQLLKKMTPRQQINKEKNNLLSTCIQRQGIASQCSDLYDQVVSSGSRDVFIMQAFMRIGLLMDSFRKERAKLKAQDALQQKTVQQEKQITQSVFLPLKKLTEGAVALPRETIKLKDRQCVPRKQQDLQLSKSGRPRSWRNF